MKRYDYDRSVCFDRSENITLLNNRSFAAREAISIDNNNRNKRDIALIIAAYNEEKVLAHTIESAVKAGIDRRDVYVVDDCSADMTARIAYNSVGKYNVMTVGRSGKGLALSTIATELQLTKRYDWIHIADADGEFDQQYFKELYQNLDPAYAAATGYVSSLPGRFISDYRIFEYTVGMDITRRFQSMADVITIIPGPTSIFRSDVFEKLNFHGGSLCEDFDVTLQIHKQNLGKILFIDTAIARTQDPQNLKDFIKQVTRWNRGVMQLFIKYHMVRHPSKINSYLTYQLFQNLAFILSYLVIAPLLSVLMGNLYVISLAFVSDVLVVLVFTVFAMLRTKRYDIIRSFPLIYGLRWLQLGIFMKTFIELFLLKKHRISDGTWERVERKAQYA